LKKTSKVILLIDKPKGVTSHDVVDEVRRKTGERRVGHAGTLDPNATGLLIVGVGRESTKRLGEIAKNTTKTYEAQIVLGEERETDDPEGRRLPISNFQFPNKSKIAKSQILKTLNSFVGEQMQTPPAYSAIKIKGKPAYKLARKGVALKLEPRRVTIYELELIKYSYPLLFATCRVSSGTYIRALARDIGRKLGTGAYLKNLRRTKIGDYSVTDALELKKYTQSV